MKKKHVVSEPRAGEKEGEHFHLLSPLMCAYLFVSSDFEAVMASFYEHVSGGRTSENENFEGKKAL